MTHRGDWGQHEWDEYFAGRRRAAGLDDPPPMNSQPPTPFDQGWSDEIAKRARSGTFTNAEIKQLVDEWPTRLVPMRPSSPRRRWWHRRR